MRESEFRKYLKKRRLSSKEIDFSVKTIGKFERFLKDRRLSIDAAKLEDLKDYISLLKEKGSNSLNTLVALARYFGFVKRNDFFIYIAPPLNAREVLPGVGQRLAAIAGENTRRKVFEGFELPPLGASQEDYPRLTKVVVDRMEAELPEEKCREVLTWNYHEIPRAAFEEQKKLFEKTSSIDEYLKSEHKRLVKEMRECMKEGRLWYEQEITPEVLRFVKDNQEICTGIRHGDKIYMTKMPFAPQQYLKEKDITLKRYYACHCPLVRTSIRDGNPKISPVFCYCSGGFEKLAFDVIFGEQVNVELLESALKGDVRCRFTVRIPARLRCR